MGALKDFGLLALLKAHIGQQDVRYQKENTEQRNRVIESFIDKAA